MTVGLVLGGGGARGFFHAGVIRALSELKIGVSEVRGATFGALIGLVYAGAPGRVDEAVKSFSMLKLFSFSPNFISEKYVRSLLRRFVRAKNIEDLRIPFSFNAVDINTGEEVVFSKGRIFPAILAAMAVPGVVAPVKCAGRLLCDGGVSANLPVHLAGCRKIIACDVNPRPSVVKRGSSKVSVMLNTFFIMQEKITAMLLKNFRGVVLLSLDDGAGMFDFRRSTAERLVEKGYSAVMKNKKKILALAYS